MAGSERDKIAVIGLGAMGAPMARHLSASGFDVLGVDNDLEAAARWPRAVVPKVADLSSASTIVTMLPEGTHVREVYDRVILPKASSGTVLIDCSTIDVETAQAINRMARDNGFAQIDAPVSGGPEAAGSGGLSLMVGRRGFGCRRRAAGARGAGQESDSFRPAGVGAGGESLSQHDLRHHRHGRAGGFCTGRGARARSAPVP